MESKTFKFNERNVCINPDVIRINDYVTIEIAEYDGVWISGSHYGFKHMFSGSPCVKGNVNFPTRIEALKSEIDRLIRRIKGDEVRNEDSELHQPDIRMMKKSVKDLKQYLFDITHVQLSLF